MQRARYPKAVPERCNTSLRAEALPEKQVRRTYPKRPIKQRVVDHERAIESEVLSVAQRYGMGTVIWRPLASRMLTGRVRKGQDSDLRSSRG